MAPPLAILWANRIAAAPMLEATIPSHTRDMSTDSTGAVRIIGIIDIGIADDKAESALNPIAVSLLRKRLLRLECACVESRFDARSVERSVIRECDNAEKDHTLGGRRSRHCGIRFCPRVGVGTRVVVTR